MKDLVLSVLVAFTCAVGFGIVFGIKPRELWLAGICGMVSRVVLILCESANLGRFSYTFLAALAGTLFAELIGHLRDGSVAKYMYPGLVLLIPGDVLYKLILALLTLDRAGVSAEAVTLAHALLGIALGCTLAAMPFRPAPRDA